MSSYGLNITYSREHTLHDAILLSICNSYGRLVLGRRTDIASFHLVSPHQLLFLEFLVNVVIIDAVLVSVPGFLGAMFVVAALVLSLLLLGGECRHRNIDLLPRHLRVHGAIDHMWIVFKETHGRRPNYRTPGRTPPQLSHSRQDTRVGL